MSIFIDYIASNISRLSNMTRDSKNCSSKKDDCWKHCSHYTWVCGAKDIWTNLCDLFRSDVDISMFKKNELIEIINLFGSASCGFRDSIRHRIAWNSSCPESVLTWLIEEAVNAEDYEILRCIIWNESVSPSALERLWNILKVKEECHEVEEVMQELARKEQASLEILKGLLTKPGEISKIAEETLRKKGHPVSVEKLPHYFSLKKGIKCELMDPITRETFSELQSHINSLGVNVILQDSKHITLQSKSDLYAKQSWGGGGIGPVVHYVVVNRKDGGIVGDIAMIPLKFMLNSIEIIGTGKEVI